jgi:hypothetical protein
VLANAFRVLVSLTHKLDQSSLQMTDLDVQSVRPILTIGDDIADEGISE